MTQPKPGRGETLLLHPNQSASPELAETQYNAGELIKLVRVTAGMLGTSVSHYEIVKKLGEGGMGVVYQARDMTLDRFVALKFLHQHLLESAEQIARFEQEARVISTLNHPNIATIHGMEQSEERRFMVLEYLPGGTLAGR